MSICCLEKQLSVCEGICGSVCPPPNTFPQQDKEGEHICCSLKPVQAGGSWDGGCWGAEIARVGGMQQGGRVHRGWGQGAGNWGALAGKPFGVELCEEVGEGALGKEGAGGSQEKGVGPQGWRGMGEGTIKGWGMHPWSRWGAGMRKGVMCGERMWGYRE